MLKQISVFIENKRGRLTDVVELLGGGGINIRAMSLADTTDFGVLRLIVNDPPKARDILKEAIYTVKITDVLAVEIPDEAGSLASVLRIIRDSDITIQYMYAFLGNRDKGALVILKCDDAQKAVQLLEQHQITVVDAETVYQL